MVPGVARKSVSTKKPRVVFYLDEDLKSDLERLAVAENRPVSNLLETVAKGLVDQARREGKIGSKSEGSRHDG